jgi:hypothetical protein
MEGEVIEQNIHRAHELAVAAQTKTFTKWLNAQLLGSFAVYQVKNDLFVELSSGVVLIQLFSALFNARGVKTPKFNGNSNVGDGGGPCFCSLSL